MPPPAAAESALVFQVAGTPLALPVAQVREVVALAALQTIPEMPRVVLGFLELDRAFIPIIRIEELLRLDLRGRDWSAERTLDHHFVIADSAGLSIGWMIEHATSLIPLRKEELARLPAGHSLNSCAEFVIPRPPPEPSVVLLEMDRLLLEKERACVRDLRVRLEERLAAVASGGE